MAGNWEVIRPAVEKVFKEWGEPVTPAQFEELRLFFDEEVADTQAQEVAAALRFSPGAAERYVKLLQYFGGKQEEKEEEDDVVEKAKSVSLWDTIAEVLVASQPEDSEYIVIKRQ